DSPAADSDGDSLQPTINGVVQRFRILLLGKSGVGKSSLIQNIFKVPEMDVTQYRAGKADINKVLESPENSHFILHDSIGYESGSLEQFKPVENFIERWSKETDVSERIHAIWLCAKIPIADGRIFEVGDERLFEINLGRVPLIMVFTQFDELVDRMELDLPDVPGLSAEQLKRKAMDNAEEAFDRLCMKPLRELCKLIKKEHLPPVIK
ncbi:hypothetical protein FRC03_005840, partial [Tulasnella sp. 419]